MYHNEIINEPLTLKSQFQTRQIVCQYTYVHQNQMACKKTDGRPLPMEIPFLLVSIFPV